MNNEKEEFPGYISEQIRFLVKLHWLNQTCHSNRGQAVANCSGPFIAPEGSAKRMT